MLETCDVSREKAWGSVKDIISNEISRDETLRPLSAWRCCALASHDSSTCR